MPRPADRNAKVDLLRAAERVFAERGLERAKVEEITARAGRSKGSFYLHFASKEEAFRELAVNLLARMSSFLDGAARLAVELDPFEDVAGFLSSWIDLDLQVFDFVWQNRTVFKLIADGGHSAQFAYLVDEFMEGARRSTEKNLALGVARGIYRADLDVELAAVVISAAYDRLSRRVILEPSKPELRPWLERLQALILGGILSDEARRRISDSRPAAREADRPVKKGSRGHGRKSAGRGGSGR